MFEDLGEAEVKLFKRVAASDEFTFAYDGEAVKAGEIDAAVLAPALFALSQLCTDANRRLNGDQVVISVRLRAGFRRGSFGVVLHLVMSGIETVKTLLGTSQFKDVEDILNVLGVIGDDFKKIGDGIQAVGTPVVVGLFALYKLLAGRRAEVVRQTPDEVTLELEGNVLPSPVNRKAWEMYQDLAVREAIEYVVGPVRMEGIEELRFEKDGQVTEKIKKDELAPVPSNAEDVVVKVLDETPSQRTWTIRQPSLDPDLKTWRFFEGKMPIIATMSDLDFIGRVNRNEEVFFTGDILRVEVVAVTKLTKGGYTRVDYNVVKVADHWHQQNLPLFHEEPPGK